MAIVKEDGSIVAGANTYGTLAECDTYHEEMGNTAWADYDDEVKEAAMIRGVLMMQARYRGRWIGYRTNNNQGVTQALDWPRKKNDKQPTQDDATVDDDPQALVTIDNIIIDVNSVPVEVQYASFEVALMEAAGNSLIPNSVGADKYVKRNKVDVIEQEYFEHRPAVDRYPLVDQLLQNLAAVGETSLTMVIGLTDDEANQGAEDATQNYLDSLSGG